MSVAMAGVGMMLSSAGAAAQDGAGLAAVRAQHLSRGINASIWFAQSPGDYTVERLRSFTTEEDLGADEAAGVRPCAVVD